MRRVFLLFIMIILVHSTTLPAIGMCPAGRPFYEKAMSENNLETKIELLQCSLDECRSFEANYELGKALIKKTEIERENHLREADYCAHETYEAADNSEEKARALELFGLLKKAQGNRLAALSYFKKAYKNYHLADVLDRITEMEKEMMEHPVTAGEIAERLSKRNFGVEPAIDLRINFEYDKAILNEQGKNQARELGLALTGPELRGKSFLLIGHTDSRGSDEYNQELSENRAATVKEYLAGHFDVSPFRIKTEGRGERELFIQADTEEEHALNRRVEVRVLD